MLQVPQSSCVLLIGSATLQACVALAGGDTARLSIVSAAQPLYSPETRSTCAMLSHCCICKLHMSLQCS